MTTDAASWLSKQDAAGDLVSCSVFHARVTRACCMDLQRRLYSAAKSRQEDPSGYIIGIEADKLGKCQVCPMHLAALSTTDKSMIRKLRCGIYHSECKHKKARSCHSGPTTTGK